MYDTPRSDSAQPFVWGSGSAQRKSHIMPASGTSHGRRNAAIWAMDRSSGLSPPWTQKILSSTIAATGRQLKTSLNCFQIFKP